MNSTPLHEGDFFRIVNVKIDVTVAIIEQFTAADLLMMDGYYIKTSDMPI